MACPGLHGLPRPSGRGYWALALHHSKSIFLYKLIMFLLKILYCMMNFLVLDIFSYFIYSRFTHRNSKIIILPFEVLFTQIVFIDPERTFTLYQLYHFSNSLFLV